MIKFFKKDDEYFVSIDGGNTVAGMYSNDVYVRPADMEVVEPLDIREVTGDLDLSDESIRKLNDIILLFNTPILGNAKSQMLIDVYVYSVAEYLTLIMSSIVTGIHRKDIHSLNFPDNMMSTLNLLHIIDTSTNTEIKFDRYDNSILFSVNKDLTIKSILYDKGITSTKIVSKTKSKYINNEPFLALLKCTSKIFKKLEKYLNKNKGILLELECKNRTIRTWADSCVSAYNSYMNYITSANAFSKIDDKTIDLMLGQITYKIGRVFFEKSDITDAYGYDIESIHYQDWSIEDIEQFTKGEFTKNGIIKALNSGDLIATKYDLNYPLVNKYEVLGFIQSPVYEQKYRNKYTEEENEIKYDGSETDENK